MRRDGDLLLQHLGSARQHILLVAPFIKAKVFKALLDHISPEVTIQVVTRWLPEEVAAGVSDLEVFVLSSARPGTSVSLLDKLHAKLYIADDVVLIGSANLTATALGWSNSPNVEILTSISAGDESVARCLEELKRARSATEEEMRRVQLAAEKLSPVQMPDGQDVEDSSWGIWLPRLGDPARLYAAYLPNGRNRLTTSVLDSADHDLQALQVPKGLSQELFKQYVGDAITTMPAIAHMLAATVSDLSDSEALILLSQLKVRLEMPPEAQWRVIRDWLVHFLGEQYEVAPQSFITRRRTAAR